MIIITTIILALIENQVNYFKFFLINFFIKANFQENQEFFDHTNNLDSYYMNNLNISKKIFLFFFINSFRIYK